VEDPAVGSDLSLAAEAFPDMGDGRPVDFLTRRDLGNCVNSSPAFPGPEVDYLS
jgi:hypothetical protein